MVIIIYYSVDLSLINAKFVSYNNWAPPPVCLPSVYLTSLHMTKFPRPSLSVFAYVSNQKLEPEWPGNEAKQSMSKVRFSPIPRLEALFPGLSIRVHTRFDAVGLQVKADFFFVPGLFENGPFGADS